MSLGVKAMQHMLSCAGSCSDVWFVPRKVANRRWRSLHGNILNTNIVVANVGALSNMQLALRTKPEVALLQELWASSEEVRSEAKRLGYVVACAKGGVVLAAVLYRPGKGQQISLHVAGELSSRFAGACVSLGGGCGCCVVSVYGVSNPSAGQKEQLSQAIRGTLEELRSLGRGSCLIGGDLNAEEGDISAAPVSSAGRAGLIGAEKPPASQRPRRCRGVLTRLGSHRSCRPGCWMCRCHGPRA